MSKSKNLLYEKANLRSYCYYDSLDSVKSLLKEYGSEIDLLRNTQYFKIAIEKKDTELLEILLKFCYETYLSDKEDCLYEEYQKELIENLIEIEESIDIREDQAKLIRIYVGYDIYEDRLIEDDSEDEDSSKEVEEVNNDAFSQVVKLNQFIEEFKHNCHKPGFNNKDLEMQIYKVAREAKLSKEEEQELEDQLYDWIDHNLSGMQLEDTKLIGESHEKQIENNNINNNNLSEGTTGETNS